MAASLFDHRGRKWAKVIPSNRGIPKIRMTTSNMSRKEIEKFVVAEVVSR